MVKVINNADDFGYSNAINYGIIDSYQYGVLTSTTLMANMPGFEHAVKLAKENPGLGIGVHCTITCGQPVLKTHKTIVQEDGNFKPLKFYLDETSVLDQEEVYQEYKAQIEKVIQAGIQPTHLDSHHHSHILKGNKEIIFRLAKEYDLPVRNSYIAGLKYQNYPVDYSIEAINEGKKDYIEHGVKCNDTLIDPYGRDELKIADAIDTSDAIVDEIIECIELNKDLDVIEVMWHPAYMDSKIMKNSSFNLPRIFERDALESQKLKTYLEKNCILSTFKDI